VKKLLNDPVDAVSEMLEGFATAHADLVTRTSPYVVARRRPADDKVGIAVGGGSGHEPAFAGYVGEGMADSAAVGQVFAAPSGDVVLESIRAADRGRGVLLLYGNYSGDVLNCRLAMQRARAEGIDVRAVFVSDDVASAPPEQRSDRRGIAGDIFVLKAAGAAAEARRGLDEVEQIARTTNERTSSMGVALTSAELPGASTPIFTLEIDEMELGMGVHGEPGVRRDKILPAREVGRILAEAVLDDLGCPEGSRLAVLVNGLGASPLLEQYVVYGTAHAVLVERGMTVERSYVGEYVTSLQMSGLSVTVNVLDDELLSLLDAPARTVRLVQ
jgi:dihydroxyacetone kinase